MKTTMTVKLRRAFALLLILFCFVFFLYGCGKADDLEQGGPDIDSSQGGGDNENGGGENGGDNESGGQNPDGNPDTPDENPDDNQGGNSGEGGNNGSGGGENGGNSNNGNGGGGGDNGSEQPLPPQTQKDVLIASKTDGLNVRAGRGASYKRLGEINEGDMLAFKSLSGGWYEVLYRGGAGYVSAAYVEERGFEKGAERTEKVVDEGKKFLGTPYVFGAQRYHWGNGVLNPSFKKSEFDCSSLMQYIFKKGAGVNLATTSREQSRQGVYVAKSQIKRGDLLFFTNDSRVHLSGTERIGHVALYLGDNYILHTASDYAVIEQISAKRWSYYVTARRVA